MNRWRALADLSWGDILVLSLLAAGMAAAGYILLTVPAVP